MSSHDLKNVQSHFAFGANWASYSQKVTESEIAEAVNALARLLGKSRLDGARFLDIGCGSGLHSLAALRMGAREVVAVDLDTDSVSTSRAMLGRFAPNSSVLVKHVSVFDLDPLSLGLFDVVYSWGVLHHTGDMNLAIRRAAAMCAPDGLFAFALYRRVWLDWFWRIEKKWYAKSAVFVQRCARMLYIFLYKVALLIGGHNPSRFILNYRTRGMEFYHDVHDWMGGWPYESILPVEVDSLMNHIGFAAEMLPVKRGKILGRDLGVFGSGCDEYLYKRV